MKYYGPTDPPYVPQADTNNNHIPIYAEYEKWFDKAGEKGVSESLLEAICRRLGEVDNKGNRKYLDYLLRINALILVRET